MKKVFVLGVGAQKGGTSWLYKYLNSYEFSDFGLHKEYHIWDAKFSALCAGRKVSPDSLIITRDGNTEPNRGEILRYAMQEFDGFYESYFAHLVAHDRWLTGDISPSYSYLNSAQLGIIKEKLEARGMQVKVVFLMRDPFERSWSGVRTKKRKNRTKFASLSDEDLLRIEYKTTRYTLKSSYHETIREVEQVFSADSIFYALYEELTTKETIDRISEFFKIEPRYQLSLVKVNASPKSESISDMLRSEVVDYYRDVYIFCNERFPRTKELWCTI